MTGPPDIEGFALFRTLAPAALEALRARLAELSARPGEYLLRQGEAADALYLVTHGEFLLFRTLRQGRQGLTAVIRPGDVAGELAIAAGRETSDVNLRAAAHSRALRLTAADYRILSEDHPTFGRAMLQLVADRALDLGARLARLQSLDMGERLRSTLADIARAQGLDTPRGVLISPAPTHEALAGMIGASREAVTRGLGELARQGVLDVRRGAILVLDAAALGS